MAAIPRTKKQQEEYDNKIASSQAADAARKTAISTRNAEDKEILKDYKGIGVGGSAAQNKADFVKKSRQETAAAEAAKRVAETGASAMSQVGASISDLGQSANTLATQGESTVGIAALENFEDAVDYDAEFDQGEKFNEGQITEDERETMNATQGFRELGGLVAEIQKERGYELKGPETPKDFAAAQKDFNEKFGEKSIGRAKEGETADQYEGRLRERNAARKALAALKPKEAAPAVAEAAGPENTVLKPMGQIAGTGFGDTTIDPNAGAVDLPTITSPQAKSSAQEVANKPASGQAPTTIQSPQARLKGRQDFGAYLEGQLSKSGGNYTFNKDDKAKAKELGIGSKEMNNFTNRLSRRDEEEPRRRRRLGQIGGNKFGA